MSGCDSNTSNPTGGSDPSGSTGGGTRNCTTCTITSQTRVTVPADRTRTTIGVGEEVYLTCSEGGVTWIVLGEGKPISASGGSLTLRAGRNAGSVTVTAIGPGCYCSITFTVIEPSGLLMRRWPGTPLRHKHGRPDCGILLQFFLKPQTVSFINCEVREKNSRCTADGFYLPFNNSTHYPETETGSRWATMADCIPGKGTPANMQDESYSGDPGGGPPWTVGNMTFPIDWEYRVWGGPACALPHFESNSTTDTAGTCIKTKDGAREYTVPSDKGSTYEGVLWLPGIDLSAE